MASTTTPPRGLKPGGRALWRKVTAAYELRPDELRVLRDACFEADLIDQMQSQLGNSLMTMGSMGQPVVSPLVSELRQHRSTLATLMRQLKLPDDGDVERDQADRSTKAREAANARWARRGA